MLMSETGQSRRFDSAPLTSGLPRLTDIQGISLHVSKVPLTDISLGGHPVKTHLALPSDPSYGVLWIARHGARAGKPGRTQVVGDSGRRRGWLFAAHAQ
jgi:hypothetical protein